jgi:hypothetical protein
MAALVLTVAQKAVIEALDDELEKAFKDGVVDSTLAPFLVSFQKYDSTIMTKNNNEMKILIKDIFRSVISAVITTPGMGDILAVLPPVPGVAYTANYKLDPAGTGTLVFTDGLLTSHTETP